MTTRRTSVALLVATALALAACSSSSSSAPASSSPASNPVTATSGATTTQGAASTTAATTSASTATTRAAATTAPAAPTTVAELVAAPAGDLFYTPPSPLPPGKPGDIIWVQPIVPAPAGGIAWKVLYHSTALDGRDIAVSGVIAAPAGGAVPAGGRPIVSWAHGTTGSADACAPSHGGFGLIPSLTALLAAGDVVVATDYEGLGTPGPHPYLVGGSEGRGVLDAARAARNIAGTGAGDRVALWGHSQGGQAVVFGREIAKSYASELDVVGTVAVAPATVIIETLLSAGGRVPAVGGFYVAAIVGLHDAFGLPLDAVLTPDAISRDGILEQGCFDKVAAAYATAPPAQKASPYDVEPWKDKMDTVRAGFTSAPSPLFVTQGMKDALVSPASTDTFIQRVCALHDTVSLQRYGDATHTTVMTEGMNDMLSWIADRFAGKPAASSC